MRVELDPHAVKRARLRGASPDEIVATIVGGEKLPAKKGRFLFRRNFQFEQHWQGVFYRSKQLEVVAANLGDHWLAITVIVRYFGRG